MLRLLAHVRAIDRRVIYTLVILVLALPLLVKVPLPIVPLPPTIKLKQYIDQLPEDALIVIAADWEAGTRGECAPITAAVMDYLLREERPFAIFALIPQGPELADALAEELALKYGAEYGEDWINWGYRPNFQTTLIAMMNDLPGTIKTDIHDVPIMDYPMMEGVRTLKDAGLLFEVTGTGLLAYYIQFCAGVPLANGCTAVVGPEQYPYLQSGQIKGLLVGLGGAAQFETLTEFVDAEGNPGGQGLRGMGSQSLGHLLVMVLIVLGNLGVWAARRTGIELPQPDAEGLPGAELEGGAR